MLYKKHVQFVLHFVPEANTLTHWGRVMDKYASWIIIGSGNGLSPVRRQAITWTSDVLLLIGPSGTKFSEIFIKIKMFSFTKLHLKMSSAKVAAILSWPWCVNPAPATTVNFTIKWAMSRLVSTCLNLLLVTTNIPNHHRTIFLYKNCENFYLHFFPFSVYDLTPWLQHVFMPVLHHLQTKQASN